LQANRADYQSSGWLVLGLVLGLLAVLASILTPSSSGMSDMRVVALVNGTPIGREKYLAYLRALSIDRKDPIRPKDSEYILQRMIEEELLVQRGVEVGLLESDKRTRAALVNAMISMATTAAEAKAPSEEELDAFFQANIGYFSAGRRLRVRQMMIAGEDSAGKANEAYQRLVDGDDFAAVKLEFGSDVALSVPDSLLPPAKLREYLGPTLLQTVFDQEAGFVSQPQLVDNGFRIAQLVDVEMSEPPTLEQVRAQVAAEYTRQAGDRTLREYLDWLKARADISYPSELPL